MTNKKHRKNGEGTLFKRKDGRWQASFIPDSGKRKYVYGKTQAEALDKLHIAQQEDKQGILATGPNQKLGEYLVQWLEIVHKPTIRISTYTQYRSMINAHLVPGLGRFLLQKLTPQKIQAFYTQKQKDGLSPGSIALMHAILHSALDNAVRWNLVPRNVASFVSLPRIEPHEEIVLSPVEAQKLIETAKGGRIEALMVLAITTGMRRGEILALRWSDVDFTNKTLYVRHTMNRLAGYGFVENEPKTKSGRRKIILADVTIEALTKHRAAQEQTKFGAGDTWKDQDLVFCNSVGGFWLPDNLLDVFHATLKKAELPDMRFHDLRHSAATILLTMGVHPKVVQELLGHSTIAITMDKYSHLLPSMQKDAMDKMNNMFKETDD